MDDYQRGRRLRRWAKGVKGVVMGSTQASGDGHCVIYTDVELQCCVSETCKHLDSMFSESTPVDISTTLDSFSFYASPARLSLEEGVCQYVYTWIDFSTSK